jgi:hypothetical protein
MRAQRETWSAVARRLKTSSIAKLRAFVKQTEPKPPAASGPSPESGGSPALDGEPVPPPLPPRRPEADTTTELEVSGEGDAGSLPSGKRLVMAPVLPGLVLLVNEDATPLVRRVAAEILATYRITR